MQSRRIRKGKVLKTILTYGHHGAESTSEFTDIDYLDTKLLSEASDTYEKVFIVIRDFLKEQESVQHNISSESSRLTIAQDIADLLRKNNLISKGEK